MQLVSTLLLATSVLSYDVVEDRRATLNFLRVRRKNTGFFEETRASDLQRECVEEICSHEEMREVYPDDEELLKQEWERFTMQCYKNKCDAQGTNVCIQQWNHRECKCKDGWTHENDEKKCDKDIDECATEPDVCPDTQCINTDGSYTCGCLSGYVENPDTKKCDDVDECLNEDFCTGVNQICLNQPGAFACQCKMGYSKDESATDELNFDCLDNDECADPLTCPQNSKCTNLDGTYECTCEAGFVMSGLTHDGHIEACKDIDECSVDGSIDCGHGECTNLVGSYECNCRESGYTKLDGMQTTSPCSIDIDECADGDHNCSENETCVNLPGSYHCIPDDNCAGVICGDMQQCDVIDGKCFCTVTGYDVNPNENGDCEDVDECENGTHNCTITEYCVNTVGSFMCLPWPVVTTTKKPEPKTATPCSKGFRWNAETLKCEDIDECQTSNGDCPIFCMNYYGFHLCYDKIHTFEPDMCHHFSSANNSQAGYFCDCYEGYHLCLDLFTCVSDDGYNEYNDEGKFKYVGMDARSNCAAGQLSVDGGCYSISKSPASHADAVDNCDAAGGSLATITERHTWWVLGNYVNHGFESFWIGSDSEADIHFFGAGECLLANPAQNMANVPPQWDRVDCSQAFSYVCQF